MNNKINKLLTQLTLEEKAALCSGVSSWETTPIPRLNIPSIFMADGPHGVRKEVKRESYGNIFLKSFPATCFPPAVTLASTWDRALLYQVGEALASECIDQKVDTILGPGINIKRNPLCGRNFEYFSEDPYLTGELASAYVNGVQSKGVGTSLKHFAVNSQEHKRQVASSEVDERALREIYLSAFEKTIKESAPYTVMCCYNPVNGVHGSDNKVLLNDILREEWGYKGIVVSDWGAVNDRVKGIFAGLNLEMPTSNGEGDKFIVDAVNNGDLDMETLDKVVANTLEFIFTSEKNRQKNNGFVADYTANHQLARKAAAEGSILLKNDDNILPLNSTANFAVIGKLAKKIRSQGSGSSQLNPRKEVSFTQALQENNIKFSYAHGYSLRDDKVHQYELNKACQVAKDKDFVIVYIGLTEDYESEAFDRTHMDIPPSHIALVEELAKVNKNIVVVLTGGSPFNMPWLDKVKGVIHSYLGGEAGGEGNYDVLFGNVNPSGKLAETYALELNDILSTPYFATDVVEYRESIYVGYRYFDTAKKPVLFPFGYGLSYTEFEYSNLRLSSDTITKDSILSVQFDIKNIGKVAGAEVAQLYIKDTESTLFVAEKELKGFDKVFLQPGETKTVTIKLDNRAFAFYNAKAKDWMIEKGDFDILVGASSRDIKLMGRVFADMPDINIDSTADNIASYYNIDKVDSIPLDEFEWLLGRKVATYTKPVQGNYDMNTVVGELDGNWFSKLFRFIFKTTSAKLLPKDATNVQKKMTREGAMNMPVRNFYAMSAGVVPYSACLALLDAFNGKTFSGLYRFIKAFFNRPKAKKDIYKE